MPTGRFEYKLLAKYPHLAPEDIITWEKYVSINPTSYKSVDYDFALGEVAEISEKATSLAIPGAERVFRYRADIVAYRDNEIHIIELKGRASPAVLGHLKAEKLLYERDEKPSLPVKMVIIAREATPELEMLAAAENIKLVLV